MVRFNAGARRVLQTKQGLQRMAHAMGLGACDRQGTQPIQALLDMNQRLGLPTGLSAMGLSSDQFGRIIEHTLLDHCHKMNPRLAGGSDYQAMLASRR